MLEISVQFSFHSGLWAAGDSRVVSLALLASSMQVHWPSPTSLSLHPAGPLGSQGRRCSYPGSASQPFTHRFSSAVTLGPPVLAGTSTFLPAVFFPSSKGCELPQAAPSPEPQQAMGSPLGSGSSPHHLLARRTRSLTLKCPACHLADTEGFCRLAPKQSSHNANNFHTCRLTPGTQRYSTKVPVCVSSSLLLT